LDDDSLDSTEFEDLDEAREEEDEQWEDDPKTADLEQAVLLASFATTRWRGTTLDPSWRRTRPF
jgi:hypothetical protein